MEVILGIVREFLLSDSGEPNGFVLDGGMDVFFPPGQSAFVKSIVPIGSRVQIFGRHDGSNWADFKMKVCAMINLDSGRLANFEAGFPLQEPEASLQPPLHHSEAMPPAPLHPFSLESEASALRQEKPDYQIYEIGFGPKSTLHPSDFAGPLQSDSGEEVPSVTIERDRAVGFIEKAFDSLHRTQALLAYMKIVDLSGSNVGQVLDEAKHTYDQALSHFERGEFLIAFEYASASKELSGSVELTITHALRSDFAYPTLVLSPPSHAGSPHCETETAELLRGLAALLSRLRWLLKNGTLPVEDLDQVRRLVCWAEEYHEKAEQHHRERELENAARLAELAAATARSAEHICRQSYLAREREHTLS